MYRNVSVGATLAALPAALLLVLTAGPAMAVHETEFRQQDVNEDGVISRDEARGNLEENYARADHDQDGVIDRSEFSAFETRAMDWSSPITGPGGIGITEGYEPERVD